MTLLLENEAQPQIAKLSLVWVSPNSPSAPTCAFENNQFRFGCEVSPEVLLTILGSVHHSPPSPFHWQTREALLQWRRCELVYSHDKFKWNDGHFKQFAPVSAEPEEWLAQKAFFARGLPLFRRGCFLSGLSFQHSRREKSEWIRWFHEQSGAMPSLDFESRRIAAAFNIRSFEGELGMEWCYYKGRVGSFPVKWQLGAPDGRLVSLQMGSDETRTHLFYSNEAWHAYLGRQFHEQIARGLYRLGMEPDAVLPQLTYELTAHERLELRHSLSRHLWPTEWQETVFEGVGFPR